MAFDPFMRKLSVPDRLALAAVFLAFAAAMWILVGAYDPEGESPLSSLRRLRNVIIVQDQAVGANVVVSYAATSVPSFVAIQQELEGPPRILAVSQLLPEGEAHNFRVPIEGGLPGGFYYAMLRKDDGDGRFDAARDGIVRDARGAAAITRFLVSDAPAR
jgi:hypothetical protein